MPRIASPYIRSAREVFLVALCAVAPVATGDADAQDGSSETAVAPPSASASLPAASPDTLTSPPALADRSPDPDVVEVSLTAEPTRLSLLPGTETDVYAYNGSTPGPTLELREGDSVVVHFRNELPEATTVHWHGLRVPFAADGSPIHTVEPGEEYEYTFTLPEGSAGTYWYHPHPHHRTAWQVGMGLYGAIVVRSDDDPLPDSLTEKLLILADNRFRADGSLDFPDPESREGRIDAENGREGDVIFVNGQITPTIPIRSGEVQRWRVINASSARVYRLALPGHTLLEVGSDGGLFERPEAVDEVAVANSERVELLVRGTEEPGSRLPLRSLPYDRYLPQFRPEDWDRPMEILTVQYTEDPPVEAPPIPESLRPIPAIDTADASGTRVVRMSQGRLDGRVFDMDRVDQSASLGDVEIWEVRNLVGMDHPFHLHGVQFQVLERDGAPVAQRKWEDSVNVPRRGSLRFIVRYDGFPGLWMYHCHILEHEDQGMMGILEVR